MRTEIISLKESDSFALYSLPNDRNHFLILGKAIRDANSVLSLESPGFLMHPFYESKDYPIIFIPADEFLKNPSVNICIESETNYKSTKKSEYLEMANHFIKATSTSFQKLVLSRLEVMDNNGQDIFQTFLHLKKKYPDAFVYLLNHPEAGTWMGASPEIFLRSNDEDFTTVSLAGTRKSNDKGGLESPWLPKEYEEQLLVTDFIQNVLDKNKIEYEKEGPVDHRAGNLFHLKTTFKFGCEQDKILPIILDFHPTPAVCGIPKKKALSFIINKETHQREYYTGFIGPVGIDKCNSLFVNLRCIKLSSSQFVLYLGGGITASSIAESEWQETVNKAETMKAVLK